MTLILILGTSITAMSASEPITILSQKSASKMEKLAALEVMRYTYLRIGVMPVIVVSDKHISAQSIMVMRKEHLGIPSFIDAQTRSAINGLGAQQYLIKTIIRPDRTKTVLIIGGDDAGVLYGAYRYAEHLGVRFYLHGDVIPDMKIKSSLPLLNEIGKPLFNIRGIQPFHDFFEGPDWWNTDDYMAHINQLAKMRMNFIGLHNYPLCEPTVWVGLSGDFDDQGRVKVSYPSNFASTARNGWGNVPTKTSDYVGGAADIFERDDYGSDTQLGFYPAPVKPDDCNLVFNRAAEMYRKAFTLAHGLGVKTCVGTETPISIPQGVRDKLIAKGLDPSSSEATELVYKGIFERISKSFPIDYYWLWISEGWTWSGNTPEEYQAVEKDIKAAVTASKSPGIPFTFATCGWVLGPQQDRTALDKTLPKECPMSCINRSVGHDPVEPGFAAIKGRPKWAIPWMENDPDLTAPQPWVGRMRYDAIDALNYGCTGLLGIHWRTKAMQFNVSALAQAGWDQSWKPVVSAKESSLVDGPIGGNIVTYPQPVANTDDQTVYQSVRYAVNGYNLHVPNGVYSVTLMFNEPCYSKAGARVFGTKIQKKTVIDTLDIFAKVGKDKALDYKFDNVRVENGWLKIEFIYQTELPCIAGIVIAGTTDASNHSSDALYSRKINCGGPAYKDFEADTKPGSNSLIKDRSMPVQDFYLDYARANFGDSVAKQAGAILAQVDGTHMPTPVNWTTGPGVVTVVDTPWTEVSKQYKFVTNLEALRKDVHSAGNMERFDYWLNTFKSMRAIAEFGCTAGELDRIMDAVSKEVNPSAQVSMVREKAIPVRKRMADLWTDAIRYQVSAVDTSGEMGTIANLEQQSRKANGLLTKHDAVIEKILGEQLSFEMAPSQQYSGQARIIVPTVRSLVEPGESLRLKVIIIGQTVDAAIPSGDLFWRPLGHGAYTKVPLQHVSRRVYEAILPAQMGPSIVEYYIKAQCGDKSLMYPMTSPKLNQTVVITSVK